MQEQLKTEIRSLVQLLESHPLRSESVTWKHAWSSTQLSDRAGLVVLPFAQYTRWEATFFSRPRKLQSEICLVLWHLFLCISPFALEFHFFQHSKNEVAILKIGRAFAYFLREQQTPALTAQGGLSWKIIALAASHWPHSTIGYSRFGGTAGSSDNAPV